MNSSNNLAISFILAGCVCLSVFFVSFSSATFYFSLFILIFGNVFAYIVSGKSNNYYEIKVYNIVFCFYVLLAINHFLGYQADWVSFTQDWRDEYKFFLMTESNQYLSINQNYKDSFVDRLYVEYGLYVFYISSIASIAYSYFDGNHLLLQFLGTTVFGCLSSILVYKILKLYIEPKKAFQYTLIFMFFSIFNFYSYNLIRDVLIAFFFICGIYFSLDSVKNKSIYKLFLMLLCNWFVFELRLEHGLLFSIMTGYMVFNIFYKNKIILLLNTSISLGLIGFMFFSKLDILLLSFDNYSNFTGDAVKNDESSLAQYAYTLPPVIKQLVITFLSQIQPFPSWGGISLDNNIYQNFHGLLQVIYSFFWFIVFLSIIKWIFIDKKITLLKKEMKILLIILLIFLLANTVNMTLRRLIGFYPFIFLIYVYLRGSFVTYNNFYKTTIFSILVYIFFIFVYMFIKL